MAANHGKNDLPHVASTTLPGSERAPAPQIRTLGPVDPTERVFATLVLRRGPGTGGMAADPADVATVVGAVTALGLTVESSDAPSRRVRVSGPARVTEHVFGTTLTRVESAAPDGSTVAHRHRVGPLSVPSTIADVVVAVLGLDDRPQARAQFRRLHGRAAATSYTPIDLGRVYRFPPDTDGTGTAIAIIELGGGFDQAELDTYFSGLGIAGPTVQAIGVDGAQNRPGQDPNGADGEVLLDIEVAGALAPGAQQFVYFAPNSDAGFLDAVSDAIHATPRPVAVSISWGQSEDDWTAQARNAMDGVFADAGTLGITVTVAAGDSGSSDGAPSGRHTDFPASSPHVLACGGTSLHADAATGAITSETVWNDGPGGGASGGGVSDAFPRPAWQSAVGVPQEPSGGRGVPDVAGNADPATGYRVLVDGADVVYGGTSAVAPLWAALIARLSQALGSPLGLINERLYAAAAAGQQTPGLHDITDGSNGDFVAGPGWDACTGLGTPDGVSLLEQLRTAP
jgi:kumamolisin